MFINITCDLFGILFRLIHYFIYFSIYSFNVHWLKFCLISSSLCIYVLSMKLFIFMMKYSFSLSPLFIVIVFFLFSDMVLQCICFPCSPLSCLIFTFLHKLHCSLCTPLFYYFPWNDYFFDFNNHCVNYLTFHTVLTRYHSTFGLL